MMVDSRIHALGKLRLALGALVVVAGLFVLPRPVVGQESAHAQPAAAAQGDQSPRDAIAHESPEGAAHEESIWPFIGKVFNFVVLAGALVYLLRSPFSAYLGRRKSEIRADLETAESMKTTAAAQIAEIDARRARGASDVAAEAQRLRELAAAERERLLAQADRDIEQKVRAARRELVEHAADLTIGVARAKIENEITDADRARLVDRYLSQVTSHE